MKTAPAAALIENLAMADFTGEASPFAGLGFKADAWKAYVTFDICQSLPALAGPVQSGNWVGYFADTLAASHGSLLHQQFNLRHAVKAYNGPVKAGQAPAIARDRIVGCVVATSFPKAPRSWMNAQNPDGATGCITACAVIFKLAEGVPKLLGDHLTSRQKQSVSIECITGLDNIGIWQASTRTLAPIDAPPDAFLPALAYEDAQGQPYPGLPHVGQLNGEQHAVVYGLGGRAVSMRGVGMTANPAERTAKITALQAERADCDRYALAAEEVPVALVGREVIFKTGRVGRIVAVTCEGEARLGGLRMNATPEDPVLRLALPDHRQVLRRLGDFAELA